MAGKLHRNPGIRILTGMNLATLLREQPRVRVRGVPIRGGAGKHHAALRHQLTGERSKIRHIVIAPLCLIRNHLRNGVVGTGIA